MSRTPSNYDLLEDITANLANAAWIEAHIDDWIGPSSPVGLGVQIGGNSDPTGDTACASSDTTRLVESARAQLADLAALREITNRMNGRRNGTLAVMTRDQARQRAHERTTPSTVGYCEADDQHCDASDEYHSLKGGLCGRCRKAFSRWPRTGDPGGDRRAFIASVKAERDRQRHATG